MKIAGFINTTLLDWEGKVACTIYLAGCNFRCPFCHNKDIVVNVSEQPSLDLEEILGFMGENLDFLDGVVISGGEPTLSKGLLGLIKKIRALGLGIKIDTNGHFPDVLDDLIGAGLVDMVAMDVKAPLEKGKYSMVAGTDVDVDAIKRSIKIIMESGIDYEFRTTVVPVLLKPEDVEEIARSLKGAKKYRLHQFRPKVCLDENLTVLDPYPDEQLLALAEYAKKYVKDVKVRGV
ncbi:MAG: anaerobic ribonucleoside-triphosphate reductase activating protein [Thermoplasmatales archaeon]|nr:anaerobic ribonucleoside-triphosphate reductase activating protein [Thermoplasmatales archaeon]